jgi:hypothetical protein
MNGQKDAEMKDRMLQFLGDPLVPTVQQVAEIAATRAGFARLAEQLVTTIPMNPERTVALRKLLEAKDCAVRAILYQQG